MISRLFERGAPLWNAAETLGEIVVVNLLLVLSALPVVTFGAGLTAAYDTARRLQTGDDHDGAARTFRRSFRANLAGATLLWLVVGAVGVAVLASWLFLPIAGLAVVKTLVTGVYMLVWPLIWAMQARFENSALRMIRNATVVAVGSLPLAVGVAATQLGVIAVIVATWVYMPQIVALLLLLGYPLAVFASTPLIERAMAPLLMQAEVDRD
ncbi:DUF624 domain-containing protein [Cellulomonas sp. URHE0023]|uniref:DUF624 domain-containing protein n=1 Tax=Cellulomonas sp. URHE0023 TaxID=1380354 RepID=UPI000485BD4D|nr:DUF624 domain-containing protein [Cellulomonas sp. URHE0023]